MIKRHPKLASALGHDPEAQDYKAKLAMDQKTYFQYYIQDDVEDGTLMDTKIPMSEVLLLITFGWWRGTARHCTVRRCATSKI